MCTIHYVSNLKLLIQFQNKLTFYRKYFRSGMPQSKSWH